ncbi:putative ABC transport system permease protein [Nitrosomonas nitrosa]|uniref:FtsX-like permease family protein n=1 Tax=Nitrosomonas nitrosa TaxID=52442 RepID=UPI000D2F86E1|nr:ABC transporter permease [Nitrosomonas nitrosa]PTR02152.1 putative ABC transport system permease protein [Nitrosomonas nitrosa]
MNRNLLFRWLTLGEWQAHRLQIVVSIIAIMLGIAMGFSIHLINTAAVSEFSAAVKSLSGQSDFQVRATQPTFDEMLYPKLAQHAGVAQASPILEIQAAIPGKADEIRNTTLKILGIDMLRAITVTPDLLGVPAEDRPFDMLMEDAIFLSPAAMEWLEVKEGDALPLRLGTKTVTLRVAGGLVRAHAGQRIAVMDIGAAQWHFDHVGVLSRIDLKLKQGISHEGFKAALERELPNHYLVIETADQEKRIHNMSRAYRINLNVLALVALFTGTFLVFSAQVLSTLRRRPQFALLRVLGLTRKQILWQILRESSLLGIVGSLLGLGFGYVLAATALRVFSGDLGGGFFPEIQPSVQFDPMAALLFFALGVGVTLLGSLMPAWEAARAHPAPALKSGSEEIALAGLRKPWPAYSCLVLAAILTQLPPVAELPVFGYFSVALLMIGGILWMPSLASLFFAWLFNVFNRLSSGALAGLALARLANAPQQAAIALSGVLASFSLMVAMAIMVASFRISIEDWLTHILPADVYVRTEVRQDAVGFSPQEQQMIANAAGIERIDFIHSLQITLDPARPTVTLIARPIDLADPGNTLPMTDDVLASAELPSDAIPIWVSEAMVDLYDYQVGKRVTLPLSDEPQDYIVAGVWRDYGRQFGAIQIQLSDYQTITGELRVNEAALWLQPDMTPTRFITLMKALPFGETLTFWQPNEIRAISLKIFDRSFAVTYLLELIAVGVGLLGVAASFSAQALRRIKEFGMLRHIGVTRGQIYRMLALEGGLLAGFGIGIGFLLGSCISLILIFIVNPQSFHWTMQLHLPWQWLISMALAMLIAAALTALLAGRQAVSGNVVRAVKEDW